MWLVDVLSEFAESAFQPGVNRGLIVVLHASFVCLLFCLMFLNLLTSFTNVHIWALLFLSTGLYTSIIWFINEVYGGTSNVKIDEQSRTTKRNSKKRN